MMKFIESGNLDELIGKEIAFIHAAQFAEHVTLATKDGCVLILTQEFDDESGYKKENRVLGGHYAMKYIEGDQYVREELGRRGIFDLKAYEADLERQHIENQKKWKLEQAEKERAMYEKLKEKFEGDAE